MAVVTIMCYSCRQTVHVQRPDNASDFIFPCNFCGARNRVTDAQQHFSIIIPGDGVVGNTIQFQTPERLKMQAVIPPGALPGGSMTVAYQPRKFALDTALANLSIHTATAEELERAPDDCRECPICLEPYSAGDKQAFLPCFHHFHEACARGSLRQSTRCPMCNNDFHDAQREAESLLNQKLQLAVSADAKQQEEREKPVNCTCAVS